MKKTSPIILASDYDGTLNQNGIADHVADAIEEFRAAGNLFGVATGRNRMGSYDVFREAGKFAFDFIIALNGAQAFDGEGNVLYEEPIRMDIPAGGTTLVKALTTRMAELGCAKIGFSIDRIHRFVYPTLTNGKVCFTAEDEEFLGEITVCHMLNTILPDTEQAYEVTAVLRKEFGEYVNPTQNGICIDIPICGMNKAVGIARYAALMGIPAENIWTAGDNYNDITMLSTYTGCAMESGCEAAKAAAKYTCKDIVEVTERILRENKE
ncbi:MAG: HAD-IIB family hydrolase [Ruminococcaceae bacterium]|nr:HAD-IIB family hydrolase [Oscillospiraceae bacterium]